MRPHAKTILSQSTLPALRDLARLRCVTETLTLIYFPSRMIAEITPGKKGGDFELPFGGNITIPPSCFGKKDVVTCCMVVPGSRHKYLPPLGQNEKLLTEILLFSTSSKSLKKPLTMTLHHYQDNFDLRDIVLLVKRVEDENWAGANFNRSVCLHCVSVRMVMANKCDYLRHAVWFSFAFILYTFLVSSCMAQ